MNNLENSGESLLRDKLLQHEFAADERAWEKMDELLATHFPPAPMPPAAPSGLTWLMGGKWILGALVIGLIGWWMMPSEHSMGTDTALSTMLPGKEEIAHKKSSVENGPSNSISTGNYATSLTGQTSKEEVAKQFNKKNTKATYKKSISANNPAIKKTNWKPKGYIKFVHNSKKGLHHSVINNTDSSENTFYKSTVNNSVPNTSNIDSTTNQNISLHPSISFLPQRAAALTDTKKWQPLATVSPLTSPHHSRRIQVGIVGGGQEAYVNNDRYKGFTTSYTFGLSAKYELTSRWSLQADLLYRNMQNHLIANFVQSSLDAVGHYYNWGYNVSSQYLAFIEMPILVKKGFFNNNAHLFGGIRPAFVQPIYRFTDTYATAPYESFASFHPSIRDGIRKFDLAFTVGADLRIWRRLWIDIRANQGIFDLSHDDFFQNNNTDVTTDAQITLRYYFFAF